MSTTPERTQELMTELASAIRTERKARTEHWAPDMQATWQQEIDERLEALALYLLHDTEPSSYPDLRDRQVQQVQLAPLFRAGGTY